MRAERIFHLAILLFLISNCGTPDKERYDNPAEQIVSQESQRNIDPADIITPDGFSIEPVLTGLSFPVDITFDEQGTAYIAEAGGHTYGTKPARAPEPRILQYRGDSLTILFDKAVPMSEIKEEASSEDMSEGIISPLTGVTYHEGKLYISHRSRYSTYDLESGDFETIINGLPSWGEFLNVKPVIHNDKLTFFLSTQGNSGVIEEHWAEIISEFNKPKAHEIPCEDITLTGKNFWVPTHHIQLTEADSLKTGAYAALGDTTEKGQIIEGKPICNGAFFRSDLDGENIERIAWGLRSSFGYRYGPEGQLVATMNSANPMPPRGLYFDYETVYEIQEGEWYGWPDFFSGLPVTDERFGVKKEEREFVLTSETHQKLLNGKERPPQPIAKLPVHSASQGLVFGRSAFGVSQNNILVANFGSIVPEFKSNEFQEFRPEDFPPEEETPGGASYNWPGFNVQQVNLDTGEVSNFIYNTGNLPASANSGGGLERPIQLEWGPDGALYIVDFGVVNFDKTGMNAHPFTGTIWKVTKE